MPEPKLPHGSVPTESVPILFPWIVAPDPPSRSMPCRPLKPIRLPRATPVPPISRFFAPLGYRPSPALPRSWPDTPWPIRLPWMISPASAMISTPQPPAPVVAEMTLPLTRMLVADWIITRAVALPRGSVPVGSMPIKLFRTELFAALVGEKERSEEHTSELQSRQHLVCR